MSPRKLTEEDKKQILQLYRNSQATTSTLAEDYDVSSSTISRFLKSNLSESEYEELIQQKRLARTHKSSPKASQAKKEREKPKLSESEVTTPKQEPEVTPEAEIPSTSPPVVSTKDTEDKTVISQTPAKIKSRRPIIKESVPPEEEEDEVDVVDVVTLGEMLGEDIDELDEDEDEEDYDDDWDTETDEDITYPHANIDKLNIQILPLTDASFPRTCYLVIDRASELITRPLEDFADLGTIPASEIQQTTLPVFDNHRVAKRFSHRRERIIKVPDGRMLQKTSSYLEAKGITRILIDGQVYSVSNNN
ncbi:MAG: hypothetical protein AB4368_28140 [Xenococcaceae cyanobacterium]